MNRFITSGSILDWNMVCAQRCIYCRTTDGANQKRMEAGEDNISLFGMSAEEGLHMKESRLHPTDMDKSDDGIRRLNRWWMELTRLMIQPFSRFVWHH